MKNDEFVYRMKNVLNMKTYYVMGGYGARLGVDYVNYDLQYNVQHRDQIEKKYNTKPLTMGFDCVCLMKSVLFWGFTGDTSKPFGGAVYDKTTDFSIAEIEKNSTRSNDFENIEIGEFVFIGNNHIGVYIGNGEVIESTPAWKCGVQRTLLPWRNSTNYEKLPVRAWDFHGKYNKIDFVKCTAAPADVTALKNENRVLKDKINAALGVLK